MADRLYLAAARVDPFDVDAVVAFSAAHGRLLSLRSIDGADIFGNARPNDYVRALAQHASDGGYDAAGSDVLSAIRDRDRVRFHAIELGYRLRIVRQLARHLIAWRRGDYVADVWPECDTDDGAWLEFKRLSDVALQPFHVRVVLLHEDPRLDYDTLPTLYNALVLQIVNDIAAGVDFHTCASCGNEFVHQEGVGKHRHKLSGVLYCSIRCKNRETQRRYRQAKKGQA